MRIESKIVSLIKHKAKITEVGASIKERFWIPYTYTQTHTHTQTHTQTHIYRHKHTHLIHIACYSEEN